jgi:hypothetical protein
LASLYTTKGIVAPLGVEDLDPPRSNGLEAVLIGEILGNDPGKGRLVWVRCFCLEVENSPALYGGVMKHQTAKARKQLYRHGDVLVERIERIPVAAIKRPHLVLAEGEITGHVHRIADPASAELYELEAERYLRVVSSTATLLHEEHGPINLPRGNYRVWRQREYSPREVRLVRD